MSEPVITTTLDPKIVGLMRRASWIAAAAATVVGLLGLIFPQTGLAVVGLLIGVYLVVAGITRVVAAFGTPGAAVSRRVMLGIIGALLLVAGVLSLNNPFGTLAAIVIVVGIAWIIDGIGHLVAAFVFAHGGLRWSLVLAGVLFVVAGVILMLVPVGAIASVYLLISSLLLAVGVVSLVGLIVSGVRERRR